MLVKLWCAGLLIDGFLLICQSHTWWAASQIIQIHCLFLNDFTMHLFSTEPKKQTKEETLSEIYQAWDFCKERSRSVEVCYKNMDEVKILTRVHFQFDPVVSTVCVSLFFC